MPEFTFQNERFARLAMRSLLVLQLAVLILILGLRLSGLFFLAVILSFLTLFAFIALIVWLYVRYRELPVVRRKNELERLVLKFQKNLQAEAKTIQACKKERDQLFRAEKEEARATLRTLQREHVENGMAKALIKEACIPGVGAKIKERLAVYGILSAAHVNHKMDELPGFGEVKRQALLSWQSSVLAKLENTKPTALSPNQLEIIKQNYQVLHDKNNAAERKAITSQQILEHELIVLKPRLRQFAAISFLGYLRHSLASRGVLAALIALGLIITQVVSSVSVTRSTIIASSPTGATSPTAILTQANTATPGYTPTSTVTDTPTASATFTPTVADTPAVPATILPTRNLLPTVTSLPLLPTLDPLQGVTAICNDGTYSYSQHSRGTCSHHSGVKQWIHKPPD